MATPSPRKLHKRFAPSRAGSDISSATVYSSSSTLVNEDLLSTTTIATPNKPWTVKALNQLGLKCKKSIVFGKGKKKEELENAAESDDNEPHASLGRRTPPPFVLDINRDASGRIKRRMVEEHEEIDLLPECLPEMLRRAPSTNVLVQSKGAQQRRQLKDFRLASTPDLRLRAKRDSLEQDPFYLEDMIRQFPRPPVHNPGEYRPREAINPSVRRQNSNFSLPTSKAYPERARVQTRHWIDRPVHRDVIYSRQPPSSNNDVFCGL
ncbi:hypothetical protein ACEPAG_8030 [Sanghuangporus baumii]